MYCSAASEICLNHLQIEGKNSKLVLVSECEIQQMISLSLSLFLFFSFIVSNCYGYLETSEDLLPPFSLALELEVGSLKLPRLRSFLLLLGVVLPLSLWCLLVSVESEPLQRLLRLTPLKMSSGDRKFMMPFQWNLVYFTETK